MKKLFLTTIVSLFIAISAMAQSGTTGDLSWNFDSNTGTLTISGTGDMPDYYYYSSIPWSYYWSDILEVDIANGVTSIGDGAFFRCSSLTSATIPSSVTSIGKYAFLDCSSLASIAIGNNVASIGEAAFNGCSSLTSATIPSSVTNIGDGVFRNCQSLTSINVAASNIAYLSEDGVLYNKDQTTLIAYPLSKTNTYFSIPVSVTSIEHYAFGYCRNLASITIPNSVISIEDYAFQHCIGLTSITIPNSVKSIGVGAFQYCISLTSVTIPNSVTSIENNTFYSCRGLTSVTILGGVTSIGNSAFSNCSSLIFIDIPNSVTSIGNGTFYMCSSLTTITIPNSVTSLENGAFRSCISLTSITIPNSVTSIGEWAFANCSSLEHIYVKRELPSAAFATTFQEVPSLCILHVPYGCKELYEQAAVWQDFFNIQEEPLSVNKLLSADISVYVQGNDIVITGVENPQVTVFDVSGRTIATGRMNSVTVKQTGVYFVRVNGETRKVLVN